MTERVSVSKPNSIGHPIQNMNMHVLDEFLEPAPIGVPGELYIGGDQVARGYLNRPDLTAANFQPNPWGYSTRLYRTGDRAVYQRDGSIEFLGRLDQQVKIRGYRIEPGEIEAVLGEHPAIQQAAVAVHDSGGKKLVGYFSLKPAARLGSAEIREYLLQRLPEYMVPVTWIEMRELPCNRSGKIDRSALPAPEAVTITRCETVLPANDMEQRIAEIFCRYLHLETVGVHESFFDLGAHSLLLAQIHQYLRETIAPDIPIVALFQYTTIQSLAAHLSGLNEAHVNATSLQERTRKQQEAKRRRRAAGAEPYE
jgi:acyl carrier protein